MTTSQLTDFQKQCRESIDDVLRDLGLGVTYRYVEGRDESYLVGRLDKAPREVEVYIYSDEAGFFLDGKWFGYETQDFSNSAELIHRFSSDLKDRLSGESLGEGR
jgi:hypothetical protein